MSTLDDIFSEENILEYARACIDLAVDIPEYWGGGLGFDTLLIPSRGAVPFFLGMTYALQKFMWSQDHKDFYENLGIPSMVKPLLAEKSGLEKSVNGKEIKTLLIPFTADLNVPKFDPSENSDEYIFKTREYWANVVASFFQSPRERRKNPYFASFVDVILRDVEMRSKIAEGYESFPEIGKFAMIDTVISGRASNEILRAFDSLAETQGNENLLPYAFLVVDDDGKKVERQRKFFAYLNQKKVEGYVRMYPIPRIISEDEGASLEGVVAVVYPSVMKGSKKLRTGNKEFFVGAGSWHIGSKSPYLENFMQFIDLIYSAIDTKYALEYLEKNSHEIEEFRAKRRDFVEYARRHGILAKHDEDPSRLNLNPAYHPERPYETGSHVVHIPFDSASTGRIIARLLNIPQVIPSEPLQSERTCRQQGR